MEPRDIENHIAESDFRAQLNTIQIKVERDGWPGFYAHIEGACQKDGAAKADPKDESFIYELKL